MKNKAAVALGRLGGKATKHYKLTREQRSAIARANVMKRWKKK